MKIHIHRLHKGPLQHHTNARRLSPHLIYSREDDSNTNASVNRTAPTQALYSATPTLDASPLTSSATAHIHFPFLPSLVPATHIYVPPTATIVRGHYSPATAQAKDGT